MYNNFCTSDVLLYENFKNGIGGHNDQDSMSICISGGSINLSITFDYEEEKEDILRPIFKKVV